MWVLLGTVVLVREILRVCRLFRDVRVAFAGMRSLGIRTQGKSLGVFFFTLWNCHPCQETSL
jgi:hypothetical protein